MQRSGLDYKVQCESRQQATKQHAREIFCVIIIWWRDIVGSAFRLKLSYSTPGPISTAMGDCLRAGKPSRCEACQLGRLSLLPSVGRQNE